VDDDGLRAALARIEPAGRDKLRRLLVADQPDRDRIAERLLRERTNAADALAEIIDLLTIDDEARRTVVRLLAEIEDAMQAQPGLSSTRMVSGLDTLFGLVDLRVKNLRVPILLVVFQIGAVTLAVLAGVGSLTLTRQTFELAVLHSRGFSRRTLLAAQGAQALLYAAVAFPLGLLLGLGLAKLAGRFNGEQLPGVEFPARLNDGAIWLGLAVALVGALVLLALSQDHRVDRRASLCVRTRDRRDHSL
jgi:hypothetical protein